MAYSKQSWTDGVSEANETTLGHIEDGIEAAATTADAAASITAGLLSGEGFPEGVVTADVGAVYTDDAATNGAVRWVKANGTGNTGWRVVYGDTGWRRIVAAGAVANMPNLAVEVRRVSQAVFLSIGEPTAPGTASGLTHLIDMPVGFQHLQSGSLLGWYGAVLDPNASIHTGAGVVLNSQQKLYVNAVSGKRHYASMTWGTDSPWPTTLPGTAV